MKLKYHGDMGKVSGVYRSGQLYGTDGRGKHAIDITASHVIGVFASKTDTYTMVRYEYHRQANTWILDASLSQQDDFERALCDIFDTRLSNVRMALMRDNGCIHGLKLGVRVNVDLPTEVALDRAGMMEIYDWMHGDVIELMREYGWIL